MSIGDNSEDPNLIKNPLWDLMLSTNDCTPGCGCDYDFFDITLERIKNWMWKNDSAKTLIINQIDKLLKFKDVDIGDIQIQTGYPFQNFEEFEEWL